MKENRSVSRILLILELISQHDEGLTLGQIYRMLDMPKATAYDFLQTLYKADAIYYKDPRLKNYVIGSKMFAIGSVYTRNSNLIDASEFELKNFANRYGKTAFICKRTEGQIVYIYKYQPSNSLIATPEEIGTVVVDLGNNPINMCFRIFGKDAQPLNEAEKVIQRQGYILSDVSVSGHISTIAVPIRNFENKVTGVISVSDLYQEAQESDEVIFELLRIARVVSKKLGYLGD